MRSFQIRKGVESDLAEALNLIQELAVFEKEPEAVITSVESMTQDGFGSNPLFEFYVAIHSNQIVGLSLFYYRYSTWKGKVLYLEDLIVTKSKRGAGIGKALFEKTLAHARDNKCQRMSWQVLDWNTPAIKFYKGYGAHLDSEWINCSYEV